MIRKKGGNGKYVCDMANEIEKRNEAFLIIRMKAELLESM